VLGRPAGRATLGRSGKLDLDWLQRAGELDRDTPSEAFTIADRIIAANGAALDRVANALVASDVLMHDDVADLCGQVEDE
jgi:hypothetical protein